MLIDGPARGYVAFMLIDGPAAASPLKQPWRSAPLKRRYASRRNVVEGTLCLHAGDESVRGLCVFGQVMGPRGDVLSPQSGAPSTRGCGAFKGKYPENMA